MTVKELKEYLARFPDESQVCIEIKNKAAVADDLPQTVYSIKPGQFCLLALNEPSL